MIFNVNFNNLINILKNQENKLIILFCYVTWSGVCKMQKLSLLESLEKLKNFDIKFLEIDIDDNYLWKDDKNDHFKILESPTIIIFKNSKEIKRISGFINYDEIYNIIINII